MLAKYVVGLNWVDFVILGLFARTCFIGTRTGIGVEIFKVIGLMFATLIACHFYTSVSDLLSSKIPALPLNASDAFVFVVLVSVSIIIIRIIRESFFLLVKIEAHNTLDRWGGMALGFFRGFWISSLVLVSMGISTMSYMEASAKSSLFGHKFIAMAPAIYRGTYENIISKLFSSGSMNEEIFKAIEK